MNHWYVSLVHSRVIDQEFLTTSVNKVLVTLLAETGLICQEIGLNGRALIFEGPVCIVSKSFDLDVTMVHSLEQMLARVESFCMP